MKHREKRLTRQIVIRVDEDMLERLERDARENERTVAGSIRHAIRQAIPAAGGG